MGTEPMLRRVAGGLRMALLAASVAAFPAVESAVAGEIRTGQRAASPALGSEIGYAIYLPDGWDAAGARFPVVYLLHGYGGGEREWLSGMGVAAALDRLIAAGEIAPLIAVSPEAGKSWYVDSARFGGPGDYETAIVRDLVAAVDAVWPSRAGRAHRGVAGVSMGGHGALRFAFGHPELFGSVAALSPAIWKPGGVSWRLSPQFGNAAALEQWFPHTTGATFDRAELDAQSPFALVARAAAHEPPPRVWLGVGDDDYFALQDGTIEMYLELRAHGLTPELRVADGGHGWDLWRGMAEDALRWFNRGW